METEKKKVQDALFQIDTLNETVEATNIHKDAIAEKLKAIALERDILEGERHNWEIDQANHSKLQEEFVELKSRKSAEIDLLKLQLEEMTVANSDISTENSRLWKEVQKLMTELECVNDELKRTKSGNVNLIEDLEGLRKNCDSERMNHAEELNAFLREHESNVHMLQLEISDMSLILQNNREIIEKLKKEVSRELLEKTDIQDLHQVTVEKFDKLKSDTEALERTRNSRIYDLESNTMELEKEIAEMILYIQELEKNLQLEHSKVSDVLPLLETLGNLKDDNLDLKTQLKMLKEKYDISTEELSSSSEKNTRLEEKVQQLSKSLLLSIEKLENADVELSVLLEDNEAYKEKLNLENIQSSNLRLRVRDLEYELNAHKEHIQTLGATSECDSHMRCNDNMCENMGSHDPDKVLILNGATSQTNTMGGNQADQRLAYYLKLSETSTQSMELYRNELLKKQEELKNSDLEILRLQRIMESENISVTT